MAEHSQAIARLMYHAAIGQGVTRKTPRVEDVAISLDIATITLYKNLEGEYDVTLNRFIALCRAYGKAFLPAMRETVHRAFPDVMVVEMPHTVDLDGRIEDELEALVMALGVTTAENVAVRGDGYDVEDTRSLRNYFARIIGIAQRGLGELNKIEAANERKN